MDVNSFKIVVNVLICFILVKDFFYDIVFFFMVVRIFRFVICFGGVCVYLVEMLRKIIDGFGNCLLCYNFVYYNM